jgi:hypothetical protein
VGFHIYTDHWWRNPKHAVTTVATLVEVERPKRPTGVVTSGPYDPSPSGYFQSVVADVTDPATGAIVRATGELYFPAGAFQVGQQVKVRWSAKRKAIELYNGNTAPEDEWAAEAGAVQVVRLQDAGSGTGQADPIERLERLGALRKSGVLTDEEFEQQKHRILGET